MMARHEPEILLAQARQRQGMMDALVAALVENGTLSEVDLTPRLRASLERTRKD